MTASERATTLTDGSDDLRRIRLANETRVQRLLAEHGGLTRRQLAERTGLSRTTISAIVLHLSNAGAVISGGHITSESRERGRPVEIVRLNPHGSPVIGCEFGRGHVAVAMANYAHEIVASAQRDLPRSAPLSASPELLDVRIATMVSLLKDTAEAAGMAFDRAERIGIAISGSHPQTARHSALVDDITSRLLAALSLSNASTRWDNNLRLAARAEARLRSVAESSNLMHVALSHGVGAGLTLDGSSVTGASGSAGEFGHVVVRADGRPCECGLSGCLERYLSVDALLDDAAALDPRISSAADLAAAADAPAISLLLEERGRMLGQAIGIVRALIDPGIVTIGGDLTVVGTQLIDAAQSYLANQRIGSPTFRLEPAQLTSAASAIGAVYLSLDDEPEKH